MSGKQGHNSRKGKQGFQRTGPAAAPPPAPTVTAGPSGYAAAKPSRTLAVFQALRVRDVAARLVAARDPATPAGILALMAQDTDVKVRTAVADNPSTPPPALARLAADWEPQVRDHADGNPHLARPAG